MQLTAFEIVQDRPYGAGVTASRPLAEGETVAGLADCEVAAAPSIHTIDVGGGRHVDGPEVRYLNHSCDPNLFVDCARMRIVTLRPVAEGEELTFFYPSTEWEMVGPFDCLCRSADCLGTVIGARHVPATVLRRYRLNAHITAALVAGGTLIR